MTQTRERYLEFTLLWLILIIGAVLLYQALPFVNGILGAVTLYILLRRTNISLAKRISERSAPWIIVLCVAFFVMIPMSCIVWYIIDLVQHFDIDIQAVFGSFENTVRRIEESVGFNLVSDDAVKWFTAKCSLFVQMLMSGINNFAISLFTALLLLFFMLSGGVRMERYIARLLPFSDSNKQRVISSISTIVKSNAIGIPLLAVIQGSIAFAGYMLIGVPNAGEMAILTGFASLVPIVGTMLVWIPLSAALYFSHGLLSCILLVLYGTIVIGSSDNILRMILQKRMANTHPLITIFGVIAGLPVFGFMGLIFGPLIVALFLLFVDMFARQYIAGESAKQSSALSRESNLKERRKERGETESTQAEEEQADTAAASGGNQTARDSRSKSDQKKNNIRHSRKADFKAAKSEHKQQKREAARNRAAQESLMQAENKNSDSKDRITIPEVLNKVADRYDAMRNKHYGLNDFNDKGREDFSGRNMILRAVADAVNELNAELKDSSVTGEEQRSYRGEKTKRRTENGAGRPNGHRHTEREEGRKKSGGQKQRRGSSAARTDRSGEESSQRKHKNAESRSPYEERKTAFKKADSTHRAKSGHYKNSRRNKDGDLPVLQTVVSHGYSPYEQGGKHKNTLKTRLITVHTAKGTVKTAGHGKNSVRRRP